MTPHTRFRSGHYETQKLLAEYLLFHYGSACDIIPPEFNSSLQVIPMAFPVRCVECFDCNFLPADARALDLGCAVGRATFELARYCRHAIGVDSSHAFIQAANTLKEHGVCPFDRIDEGSITTSCVARVPEGIDRSRVQFESGDALQLPVSLGAFDFLLAANLLCRLREPRLLLERLPALVSPGGQLLITTPCTWLDEFTPGENWLTAGGIPTLEALQSALHSTFAFKRALHLPFLIREHSRKYQVVFAQASLWHRRPSS